MVETTFALFFSTLRLTRGAYRCTLWVVNYRTDTNRKGNAMNAWKPTTQAPALDAPTTVRAIVYRTAMCGGGTAYSVYFKCADKRYRPISGHCYATIHIHDGGPQCYNTSNFYRTPTLDELPAMTNTRLNAFKRLERSTDRLAFRIAKRAFPELGALPKLPTLWAQWNKESAQRTIRVRVSARYLA